jgi:hypothetical protein
MVPRANAYWLWRKVTCSLLNSWEQVKEFRVLPTDLAKETGEPAPSIKVTRDEVGNR